MTTAPSNYAPYRLIDGVEFGENVLVYSFVNLYGCRIGDETQIGPFVEIQKGATIGARCKVQSHAFICEGVAIGDEVFVGHGVMFVNTRFPKATTPEGRLRGEGDWELERVVVERRASIGSGALVMCGLRIGEGALIGAGAVVTRDVDPGRVVAGNPARSVGGVVVRKARSQ